MCHIQRLTCFDERVMLDPKMETTVADHLYGHAWETAEFILERCIRVPHL